MPRTAWTEQRIRELASTCSSRFEFKRASQSAYNAARKIHGLLDEYFGYTQKQWDEESIRALAGKYKNRTALAASEDVGALDAARRLGIIDEVFPLHAARWDIKRVTDVANQCSSRTEFQHRFPGAYGWAAKNNLLDTFHVSQLVPWTERALVEESLKYDSKSAFRSDNGGAYNAALKMGLIDTLFQDKYTYWDSEELIRAEASKYTYKVDFMRGAFGAYRAATRLGILNTLGFKAGRYGYDSSKPGYIYICDLRLTDSNDGVMFGVTNQGSRNMYHPADKKHISNLSAYLFLNGVEALATETELKRQFLANKINSLQSPLSTKLGTSGEIVTGVQRSIVELALLNINSKFYDIERW